MAGTGGGARADTQVCPYGVFLIIGISWQGGFVGAFLKNALAGDVVSFLALVASYGLFADHGSF